MKLCNETITVFNAKQDPSTGDDVYLKSIIIGASWFGEIVSNVDSSGLKVANKFTVRIPVNADFRGKTYLDPKEFERTGTDQNFTLQSGDIIVRGAVIPDGLRPADLQAQYSDVFTVLSVTDDRRAPNAKHWKVVGS